MLKFSWFKKPALLIVSCIIIFAIGAGFVYKTNRTPASDESSKNFLPASVANLNQGEKIENAEEQPVKLPIEPAAKPNNDNKSESAVPAEGKASAIENQIVATLFVEDKKYEISVPEDSSVYELMEKLRQETDFRFSGKNYPEMGFFVEEINGIKNNPKTSQYWIYYANNKSANQGISGLKIKQGDIIMWKYEVSQ